MPAHSILYTFLFFFFFLYIFAPTLLSSHIHTMLPLLPCDPYFCIVHFALFIFFWLDLCAPPAFIVFVIPARGGPLGSIAYGRATCLLFDLSLAVIWMVEVHTSLFLVTDAGEIAQWEEGGGRGWGVMGAGLLDVGAGRVLGGVGGPTTGWLAG
jgi:hypothetical protein